MKQIKEDNEKLKTTQAQLVKVEIENKNLVDSKIELEKYFFLVRLIKVGQLMLKFNFQ